MHRSRGIVTSLQQWLGPHSEGPSKVLVCYTRGASISYRSTLAYLAQCLCGAKGFPLGDHLHDRCAEPPVRLEPERLEGVRTAIDMHSVVDDLAHAEIPWCQCQRPQQQLLSELRWGGWKRQSCAVHHPPCARALSAWLPSAPSPYQTCRKVVLLVVLRPAAAVTTAWLFLNGFPLIIL
jgi:hypothetical protein